MPSWQLNGASSAALVSSKNTHDSLSSSSLMVVAAIAGILLSLFCLERWVNYAYTPPPPKHRSYTRSRSRRRYSRSRSRRGRNRARSVSSQRTVSSRFWPEWTEERSDTDANCSRYDLRYFMGKSINSRYFVVVRLILRSPRADRAGSENAISPGNSSLAYIKTRPQRVRSLKTTLPCQLPYTFPTYSFVTLIQHLSFRYLVLFRRHTADNHLQFIHGGLFVIHRAPAAPSSSEFSKPVARELSISVSNYCANPRASPGKAHRAKRSDSSNGAVSRAPAAHPGPRASSTTQGHLPRANGQPSSGTSPRNLSF